MLTDDVAAYLEEFGQPVVLPNAVQVVGIFSSPRALNELEKKRGGVSPLELVLVQPKLWLASVDAESLQEKQVVEIAGHRYCIDRLLPDGYGMTEILLSDEPGTATGPEGWR